MSLTFDHAPDGTPVARASAGREDLAAFLMTHLTSKQACLDVMDALERGEHTPPAGTTKAEMFQAIEAWMLFTSSD